MIYWNHHSREHENKMAGNNGDDQQHHGEHGHQHHQHGDRSGDPMWDHKHAHNHHSFDQAAADWDSNPFIVEASLKAYETVSSRARALSVESTRVLDLGCGTGQLSAHLAPRVKCVVGVDTSEGMVGVFNAKVASKYANARAVCITLETKEDVAKLGGEEFDLIVSNLVLHHIPDMRATLGLLVEHALVSGGQLALTDFEADDKGHSVSFHDPAIVESHGVKRHGIDREEIKGILVSIGLKDVSVEWAWTQTKVLGHEGGRRGEFPFLIVMGTKS
ncbi:hypothetical protein HK101_000955 [Irineochytrium annulatum]|nr:hypothetical protein HK101_000955 [Irineochytrium annulatum]